MLLLNPVTNPAFTGKLQYAEQIKDSIPDQARHFQSVTHL